MASKFQWKKDATSSDEDNEGERKSADLLNLYRQKLEEPSKNIIKEKIDASPKKTTGEEGKEDELNQSSEVVMCSPQKKKDPILVDLVSSESDEESDAPPILSRQSSVLSSSPFMSSPFRPVQPPSNSQPVPINCEIPIGGTSSSNAGHSLLFTSVSSNATVTFRDKNITHPDSSLTNERLQEIFARAQVSDLIFPTNSTPTTTPSYGNSGGEPMVVQDSAMSSNGISLDSISPSSSTSISDKLTKRDIKRAMEGNPEFRYDTRKIHSKTSFKCWKCPGVFLTMVALDTHSKGHGANHLFSCIHCDYTHETHYGILRHDLVHTPSSKSVNYSHRKSHAQQTPTNSEDNKESNSSSASSSSSNPSTQNSTNFDAARLAAYKEIEEKNYACLGNPDIVYPPNGQDKYNRTSTSRITSDFKCFICPYSTFNWQKYKNHKERHSENGTWKFSCDYCSFRCSQAKGLKTHHKMHITSNKMKAELVHKCPEEGCGKAFSTLIKLSTHKTKEHNAKKPMISCFYCSFRDSAIDKIDKHHQWFHPHRSPLQRLSQTTSAQNAHSSQNINQNGPSFQNGPSTQNGPSSQNGPSVQNGPSSLKSTKNEQSARNGQSGPENACDECNFQGMTPFGLKIHKRIHKVPLDEDYEMDGSSMRTRPILRPVRRAAQKAAAAVAATIGEQSQSPNNASQQSPESSNRSEEGIDALGTDSESAQNNVNVQNEASTSTRRHTSPPPVIVPAYTSDLITKIKVVTPRAQEREFKFEDKVTKLIGSGGANWQRKSSFIFELMIGLGYDLFLDKIDSSTTICGLKLFDIVTPVKNERPMKTELTVCVERFPSLRKEFGRSFVLSRNLNSSNSSSSVNCSFELTSESGVVKCITSSSQLSTLLKFLHLDLATSRLMLLNGENVRFLVDRPDIWYSYFKTAVDFQSSELAAELNELKLDKERAIGIFNCRKTEFEFLTKQINLYKEQERNKVPRPYVKHKEVDMTSYEIAKKGYKDAQKNLDDITHKAVASEKRKDDIFARLVKEFKNTFNEFLRNTGLVGDVVISQKAKKVSICIMKPNEQKPDHTVEGLSEMWRGLSAGKKQLGVMGLYLALWEISHHLPLFIADSFSSTETDFKLPSGTFTFFEDFIKRKSAQGHQFIVSLPK